MITLYTTFFDAKDNNRINELKFALLKNFNNPIIDKIVIFNENGANMSFITDNNKLKCIKINDRPRFIDIIKEINQSAETNDISIIANTDIFFGKSLQNIFRLKHNNTVYALSRYDILSENRVQYFKKWDSQDVWIIRGKIFLKGGNYYLGQPGCDNKLAYEIISSGYKVIDNSFDIVAFHVHSSDIRTYNLRKKSNVVDKPYFYLIPEFPENVYNPDLTGFFNFIKRVLICRQMNYEFIKENNREDGIYYNKHKQHNWLNKIKYFDFLRVKSRCTYFKLK